MGREDKPVFEPFDFIKHIAERMGVTIEELRLPPIAVLVFNSRLLEVLIEKFNASPKQWIYRDVLNPVCTPYLSVVDSKQVALILPGWGAPRAVSVAEEMIACGVSTFFIAGLCGALVDGMEVGDLVVPTEALIDEGTSRHYVSDATISRPDEELTQMLKRACEELGAKCYSGRIWSTDAPYRETLKKVYRYRNMGAICVDMETSALYTLSAFRRVKAAALHVVSDILLGPRWTPGFRTERLVRAYSLVGDVLRSVIARM